MGNIRRERGREVNIYIVTGFVMELFNVILSRHPTLTALV